MTDTAHDVVVAYSATARSWAAGPERIYDVLASVVAAASKLPWSGVCLDVGTGTGAAARAVIAAGATGVVAIDPAVGMLRHDAATRPAAVAADALALPFATASVDGAIAAFSLNHVRLPALGIGEMARVVRPGGPVVVAAYAADDTHPVKACVEAALAARGWVPPRWYEVVRAENAPLLATPEGCRAALDAVGVNGDVHVRRVPFADLTAEDLVAWRLGMAQHAPFVESLDKAQRRGVERDAIARLGAHHPPLVRSILVISAASPPAPAR